MKQLQQYPDSQQEPFGPKQLAYIKKNFGLAYFRNAKPMVKLLKEKHENPKECTG